MRWLEQVASALDAAHAEGMVHRDVKPANLLLDAQGTLKVADFGIATLATDSPLTQTGQVVGTAAYFSPEQAMGKPATAASDRYALAVLAYELLTGQRPFPPGPPAAQALARVDTDPPPASSAAPGLPAGVDAVLAAGMAREPDQRPPTAAALVAGLEDALGATVTTGVTHPVAAPTEKVAARAPRTPRPAPAPAAVVSSPPPAQPRGRPRRDRRAAAPGRRRRRGAARRRRRPRADGRQAGYHRGGEQAAREAQDRRAAARRHARTRARARRDRGRPRRRGRHPGQRPRSAPAPATTPARSRSSAACRAAAT